MPGVVDTCREVKRRNWLLVVLDFSPENLSRLRAVTTARDLGADHYLECGHDPSQKCICALPRPYLLESIAKIRRIDLARSVFVGCSYDQIGMARAAGVGTVKFTVPNSTGFSDAVRAAMLPTPHAPAAERPQAA